MVTPDDFLTGTKLILFFNVRHVQPFTYLNDLALLRQGNKGNGAIDSEKMGHIKTEP